MTYDIQIGDIVGIEFKVLNRYPLYYPNRSFYDLCGTICGRPFRLLEIEKREFYFIRCGDNIDTDLSYSNVLEETL